MNLIIGENLDCLHEPITRVMLQLNLVNFTQTNAVGYSRQEKGSFLIRERA